MTIKGPDISNFQGGLTLAAGTPFVFAKGSEGSTYKDPTYAGFKSQAARIGAVFSGYHFLHAGNIAAQVANAHAVFGATPIFLDVEATGPSRPQLGDITAFIDQYRAKGGRVWGVYLPKWYWSGSMGSPGLKPLADRGLHLISSDYTAYSDNGPGWGPYGGMAPALWQYTDRQLYGGKSVDFNAYRGTKDQLAAAIAGNSSPAPASSSGTVSVSHDEDSHMHLDLKPGEPRVITNPTAIHAAKTAICLSCDFAGATVRLALYGPKGWNVLPPIVLDPKAGAWRRDMDGSTNKLSIEVTGGIGAAAPGPVGLDLISL